MSLTKGKKLQRYILMRSVDSALLMARSRNAVRKQNLKLTLLYGPKSYRICSVNEDHPTATRAQTASNRESNTVFMRFRVRFTCHLLNTE